MNVEPLKALPGWREILRVYGMIVHPVITALALERASIP
jgi:hypothetical protein